MLEPTVLCSGVESCGKHELPLRWIDTTVLELRTLQTICCNLLGRAAALNNAEALVPDPEKTTIICDGNLKSIEWEPFKMRAYNNPPPPSNALQATLGDVCLRMTFNTEYIQTCRALGKTNFLSRDVLSRIDIAKAFENSRGKDIHTMCNAIRSIRTQDFTRERVEWYQFEMKKEEQPAGK